MLGNKIFQQPILAIGSFLGKLLEENQGQTASSFLRHHRRAPDQSVCEKLLNNIKNEVTYQRKISHACNLGLPPCTRTEPWHHHTPQQRTCLLRSFPIRKTTWNQPVKLIKAENNCLIW